MSKVIAFQTYTRHLSYIGLPCRFVGGQ